MMTAYDHMPDNLCHPDCGPQRRHTPARSIRVPDALWQACRERAEREGTTVTAVILRALERYARGR